ncbi:GFA family protein [Pleionea sp. CnH1-48]|uniref:GFA family protein n=1 Tax=Pleionea sp. CnH1-48 TaxID=2954494 RepID=UPI0020976DBB|nr:GFA family protein [Pleionea sp. CnH1-48]MCO7224874.1 GFA family protein [Pleionea sp. CnH1-48]
MHKDKVLEGGCLCGAIRYRVYGEPFAAEYCHCRMCQKVAGAPVSSWMDFKVEQVQWFKGSVFEYSSSEHVRRGFCRDCGATLSFRDSRHPDYFTLAIPSLDEPEQVQPTYHIYTESEISWHRIADDLKRFPQSRQS